MTAASPAPFYGGLDQGIPFQLPFVMGGGPFQIWYNPPIQQSWYVLEKIDVVFDGIETNSNFQVSIYQGGTDYVFHSGQTGAGNWDHFPWYGPLAIAHGQVLRFQTPTATCHFSGSGVILPQITP